MTERQQQTAQERRRETALARARAESEEYLAKLEAEIEQHVLDECLRSGQKPKSEMYRIAHL